MSENLPFCVVSYRPDLRRSEMADVGILLFGADGPRMELTPNLSKVLALDPNADPVALHQSAHNLLQALRELHASGVAPKEAVAVLGPARLGLALGALGVTSLEGRTEEQLVMQLMALLVTPPTPLRTRAKPTSSRLHTELRKMFEQAKMLGTRPGDIDRHLVVPKYPIDAETGLFAEFALRNGRLHVTETVDFRVGSTSDKRREAQAKTLVLLQALQTVGSNDLQRYVVVSGVSEIWAQPSLALLSKHTEYLVVRESTDDWSQYVRTMKAAASADGAQLH